MTMPTPQPDLAPTGSGPVHTSAPGERPTRPGWPEVGVAAIVYLALYGVTFLVLHAIPDDRKVATGLVGYAFSALLGLCAFAAACSLRIRDLRAFGVRRVRWTWLLAGVGLGVVTILVSNLLGKFLISTFGSTQEVQSGYQAAATGGPVAFVATLLLGAVATSIGEEVAFRGVLTNALGRYGAWVAVLGSALVFAVAHGINVIFGVAVIDGLIAALLFRKTGSIWPGVLQHVVNNGWATLYPLVLPTLVGAAS